MHFNGDEVGSGVLCKHADHFHDPCKHNVEICYLKGGRGGVAFTYQPEESGARYIVGLDLSGDDANELVEVVSVAEVVILAGSERDAEA